MSDRPANAHAHRWPVRTAPVRPVALAGALRPVPARPSRLAELALGLDGASAFRHLVRAILPEDEAAIMGAEVARGDRETARVHAFLARIGARFPVYDLDRYAELLEGVPYYRDGWADESRDAFDLPVGDLLMLAVAADPYDDGHRIALYEHLAALGIPPALLRELPPGGVAPESLAARFAGTRWEAVAHYAAWVHASTGTLFLDLTPDDPPCPVAWTRENMNDLAEQARAAEGMLRAIHELSTWLGAEPVARCAALVAAVTGDASRVRLALLRGAIEERWATDRGGTAPYLEIAPDQHRAIPA